MSNRRTFLSILAIPLGLWAILLTNSRATILTFVLIVFLYYCNKTNIREFLKKFFSIILITISVLIFIYYAKEFVGNKNITRFEEIKDIFVYQELPANVHTRVNTLSWMPKYLYNSRYFFFGSPQLEYSNVIYLMSTDNQYLSWFAHYGIICLLLMLVWVLWVLLYFLSLIKNMQKVDNAILLNILRGAMLVWFWLILQGFSQNTFFVGRLREFLFFLIAFVIGWANNERLCRR